jgi:hypothetical protein
MPDIDARELARLVGDIDADPNPLHGDITPSVLRLIELGLDGAEAVLDLLDAPDPVTRRHAQRVLEGVAMRRNGWVAGSGYTDARGEQAARDLIAQNGGYRADAPPGERAVAIAKWRAWIAATRHACSSPGDAKP